MLILISDFLSDLDTSSPTGCPAKASYASSHLTSQYTIPFTSTNFFPSKNHKSGWFWDKTILTQIQIKPNCWPKFIIFIWTSPLHPSGNFYGNCMKLYIFEMFIPLHERLVMRVEQGWGANMNQLSWLHKASKQIKNERYFCSLQDNWMKTILKLLFWYVLPQQIQMPHFNSFNSFMLNKNICTLSLVSYNPYVSEIFTEVVWKSWCKLIHH